jgi:hypothetical protein
MVVRFYPPRIMPISKNIGFNNLLEKVIFNLVNAICEIHKADLIIKNKSTGLIMGIKFK